MKGRSGAILAKDDVARVLLPKSKDIKAQTCNKNRRVLLKFVSVDTVLAAIFHVTASSTQKKQ
jgi:hypothetical protein